MSNNRNKRNRPSESMNRVAAVSTLLTLLLQRYMPSLGDELILIIVEVALIYSPLIGGFILSTKYMQNLIDHKVEESHKIREVNDASTDE